MECKENFQEKLKLSVIRNATWDLYKNAKN